MALSGHWTNEKKKKKRNKIGNSEYYCVFFKIENKCFLKMFYKKMMI